MDIGSPVRRFTVVPLKHPIPQTPQEPQRTIEPFTKPSPQKESEPVK